MNQAAIPARHHQEALTISQRVPSGYFVPFDWLLARFTHWVCCGILSCHYLRDSTFPKHLYAHIEHQDPYTQSLEMRIHSSVRHPHFLSHVSTLSSSDNLSKASLGTALVWLWGSDHDI